MHRTRFDIFYPGVAPILPERDILSAWPGLPDDSERSSYRKSPKKNFFGKLTTTLLSLLWHRLLRPFRLCF